MPQVASTTLLCAVVLMYSIWRASRAHCHCSVYAYRWKRARLWQHLTRATLQALVLARCGYEPLEPCSLHTCWSCSLALG